MSLSVESALESFDFLEQDVADETESTPRSTASGGSECHDTGYNSTDDYNKDFGVEGGADASYIVDFFTSNKTVDNLVSSTEENRLDKIDEYRPSKEFEEENDRSSYINDQDNADIDSSNDSPNCITDIFSSLPSTKSMESSASEDDAVKFKEETINEVPSNTSSPRKRIEAGELIQESPQHSSYKTRSSRATSPNLSSSYAPEATVGNKVLDKVGKTAKLDKEAKNLVEKQTRLCCFFSLKVRVAKMTITWTCIIKLNFAGSTMVSLWCGRTGVQSRDYQNFLDAWITKFSYPCFLRCNILTGHFSFTCLVGHPLPFAIL